MTADDQPPKSKCSVLIVEDNQDVRTPLKLGLELLGFKVIESSNGTSALERFASDPTDVAIIDQRLPDILGLDIGRRIRESDIGSGTTLALLTGSDGQLLREEASRIGFDGFFVKPVSIQALCEWIEEKTGPLPANDH